MANTITHEITLERCKRTDPRYVEIRNRHYVPNAGVVGRALHYLAFENNSLVGIISGGSSTYAVKARDEFFGLDLCKAFDRFYEEGAPIRPEMLGTIINNTIFRLEVHKPNLATRVLAHWRRQIVTDWEDAYGDGVMGFETYILEHAQRVGTLYKADNWTHVGKTSTGKLLYCKRNDFFYDYDRGECLLNYEVVDLLRCMYESGK
jgi:hypothetical protein